MSKGSPKNAFPGAWEAVFTKPVAHKSFVSLNQVGLPIIAGRFAICCCQPAAGGVRRSARFVIWRSKNQRAALYCRPASSGGVGPTPPRQWFLTKAHDVGAAYFEKRLCAHLYGGFRRTYCSYIGKIAGTCGHCIFAMDS